MMVPRDPRYIACTVGLMDRIAEGGVPAWEMEWESDVDGRFRGGRPPLRQDGTPFRGESQERLWGEGPNRRHWHPYWLTATQARAKGGTVRSWTDGVTVPWERLDAVLPWP